jgi:glucose-1-phosphate thymidylyltransferase
MRKGILLAGGMGTRLHPATGVLNKHLLSVYDKPMFYYPLSVLMLAGIREIVVISTPSALPNYRAILSKSGELGLTIDFVVQERPAGIAEAFLLAEPIIAGHPTCLVLADNIFFGMGLSTTLKRAAADPGATIFSYPVRDPVRFGIVEMDGAGRALSLEEKPTKPKSNLAVPGLYFYDEKVTDITRRIKPSERGELEITDVNRSYLARGELMVRPLGRGTAWLDAGNSESLLDACNFVASVERRQGLKIGCIEEIAWRNRWIDDTQLLRLAAAMPACEYRDYIQVLPQIGPVGGLTQ